MKYPDNTCEPVWIEAVLVVVVGKEHDITVVTWVHRVLCAANVICCVIDSKSFVTIDFVTDNGYTSAVCICECMVIPIVILLQEACEQMILKSRDKVLNTK